MTALMGIVNITRDSYSDGGHFLSPQNAIAHAIELYESGAAVIDLGPSSSHPGAPIVPPETEIEHLEPVLDALLARQIPISIDSFHPETQRYAIAKGVQIINDVHGFPHPYFYPELASSTCSLVVMQNIHGDKPAERIVTDPRTIMSKIYQFFDQRINALVNAGIAIKRLILDPGMGYFLSSEPEASLVVLQNIRALKQQYNLPVLVSVSRKSFIQRITEQAPIMTGAGTLSTELFAAAQGVDWIRTHDVRALRDGLAMQNRLAKSVLEKELEKA